LNGENLKVFDIPNGNPVLPSAGIAYYAPDPQDVERWIKSMHTGWCIPGKNMGPDLMAWILLNDGRLLLVIFQAKCHLSGNLHTLTADVTADAIRSLIPKRFFSNLTRGTAWKEIDDMLKAINEEENCFTGARYNILRVVAAYPLDADVNSQSSKNIQQAILEDNHPLATLLHAPLLSSLARDDATPSVLSSLRKRIRDDVGDQDENGQPGSKSRKKSGKLETGGAKSGMGDTKSGPGGAKSRTRGGKRSKKNR